MPAIASETRLEQLTDECCRAGVLSMFESILGKGETAEFAAMCALRKAPGSKNTDRAFQDGARRQMESMDPENVRHLLATARKAGINPNGKYYKGSLGRYTDPAAWVSTAQDVIESAKHKQMTVEGVVNAKYGATDLPPVRKPMAEDIVRDMEQKVLAKDTALAAKIRGNAKARQELRDRVVASHQRKTRKASS